MKTILLTIGVFFALVANVRAADRLERSALLSIPEEVTAWSQFDVEVAFRWDEDTPLKITIWSLKKGLSVAGEIEFFDENGKMIRRMFPTQPASMPQIQNAERIVTKGEVVKLGLYYQGGPVFERRGVYYAVATFSSTLENETDVRFTTKKRWFKVSIKDRK
jgi:hypothetical protein